MPRPKKLATAETSSAPPISRLKMGETGFTGLKICNKQIYEERRVELRWPRSNATYKMMSEDATVFSALQLFEMMVSRINWYVEIPDNASEEFKKRAKFLEECKDDMEHSWLSFIKEICSAFTYGYSVHEKVFRRRYYGNGSKYNDGFVGIKKLPVRSQDTISGWIWSDDGRELKGCEQDTTLFNQTGRFKAFTTSSGDTKIKIPRDKFLLFRVDSKRDNPEGRSPLKGCYVAWKYRLELEEQEAINLVRGLGGIPVLRMASRYMSEDASPEEQAIYQYYQNIMINLQSNQQSCVIIPSEYDPDTKQPLFDISLMGIDGNQNIDSSRVISRWDNKILMALFSDLLKMGQEQLGSFALADSKTSIMAMAVEARLKEIADVLNNDLIPELFRRNKWSLEELPKFMFEDVNEFDLDVFSAAVQRVCAVGAVEMEPAVYDKILDKVFDLPPGKKDRKIDKENIIGADSPSRSGDGMAAGTGNGTSTKSSSKNNSTANKA